MSPGRNGALDRFVRIKRRTELVTLCGAFVCLTISCTPTHVNDPERQPSTLVIGAPESAVTGSSGPATGLRQPALALSQEGLTLVSVDGRVLPRLAENWRWESGGKRLVVTLRDGVTFHDGTPLKAPLVAKLLKDAVVRPGNRAQYPSLGDVIDVRPQGDELAIEVTQYSSFLPEDLELPITLPNSVGTGAFRIATTDASQITLKGYEKYYLGPPAIGDVTIRAFPTLRTAWSSLLRGEIDMVTNVPPDAIEFVQGGDVAVMSYARRFQFLIAFNSRQPSFRSPAVRRALNMAVDRQKLIQDVLRGRGVAATGPLWPQHWAYDTSLATHSFNMGLANSMLDEAGLSAKPRSDGFPARLQFTCLIPANFSVLERLALEVQRQMYAVGVDMQFEVVDPNEYTRRLETGQFDAALIDLIEGPTPSRAYIFWRSRRNFQGLNLFGYENQEAERLFDAIRQATNEGAVRSAMRRLQQVFLDDPPALFLVWNEGARAVSNHFKVVAEEGRDPLYSIWRWAPAEPE